VIKIFEDYISDMLLDNINKRGIDKIVIDGNYYIYLYHGTNKNNFNKIIYTGKFKSGTFFTTEFDVAKRYSLMTGSKKSIVLAQYIRLDYLFTSGDYFVSKQDIFNTKYGASIYEKLENKK